MSSGTFLFQPFSNFLNCFLELVFWQTSFHLHGIKFQPQKVYQTAQLLLIPIDSYAKIGTDIVKLSPKSLCFLKLFENYKKVFQIVKY